MTPDLDTRPPSPNGKLKDGEGRRSVFRQRAVKHYLEGREKEVLPQFVSPRSFSLLWIVFALLLGGAAAGAYFTQIPLYASGPAVVIKGEGSNGGPAVAAFLPPEHLQDLQRGGEEKLLLQLGPKGERRSLPVNSVVPEVVSPGEARERFDLQSAERKAVARPAAVAMAPLENLPGGMDRSEYEGGVYQAEVEVGSQRAISLVPVVGEWFKEGGR